MNTGLIRLTDFQSVNRILCKQRTNLAPIYSINGQKFVNRIFLKRIAKSSYSLNERPLNEFPLYLNFKFYDSIFSVFFYSSHLQRLSCRKLETQLFMLLFWILDYRHGFDALRPEFKSKHDFENTLSTFSS